MLATSVDQLHITISPPPGMQMTQFRQRFNHIDEYSWTVPSTACRDCWMIYNKQRSKIPDITITKLHMIISPPPGMQMTRFRQRFDRIDEQSRTVPSTACRDCWLIYNNKRRSKTAAITITKLHITIAPPPGMQMTRFRQSFDRMDEYIADA